MLLICHTQLLFLLLLSNLKVVHAKVVYSDLRVGACICMSWVDHYLPSVNLESLLFGIATVFSLQCCSLMMLLFQHHGQLFSPQSTVSEPRTAPRARLLLRWLPVPSNNSQRCYENAGEANQSSLISNWCGGRRCITMGAQNKMKQYPGILQSVHFGNCSGPAERFEGSL